eukprot:CAMPEP_0118666426 /NCGR_PEP_ID=MMETSP0785-20121206/19204_1 /TAXON_ID=91992 /ORGANISM="Bolidomonas pacifica, Strain CCMP 1866" /LENGTH=45 /DNA_ID= /DNA_START= /DNA_END= /DNA_ORIENTATION=
MASTFLCASTLRFSSFLIISRRVASLAWELQESFSTMLTRARGIT